MKHAKRLLLALLVAAAPAAAVLPDEQLQDPALEARARAISRQLRCVVCQNQSIDDSDAPLARDLRIIVRERLQSGESDAQAIAFLVARYGHYVLLKPPFELATIALWGGPFIVLLLGGGFVLVYLRRRRPAAASPPLEAADEARLAALLKEESH
ncbi:MAG TPA: cytochrome c-type biogenesis protein [Sphingobium sp.]|nr:cytochrome c-type biogenesis protein [Sphingobium sp.]